MSCPDHASVETVFRNDALLLVALVAVAALLAGLVATQIVDLRRHAHPAPRRGPACRA